MPPEWRSRKIGVDANGRTERTNVGGREVIVHYDDLPDCDVTTVRGLACTTPLRTVIDIAPDLDPAQLDRVVDDCLGRGLFTVAQAMARTAEPDMASRRGAQLLRALLRT